MPPIPLLPLSHTGSFESGNSEYGVWNTLGPVSYCLLARALHGALSLEKEECSH